MTSELHQLAAVLCNIGTLETVHPFDMGEVYLAICKIEHHQTIVWVIARKNWTYSKVMFKLQNGTFRPPPSAVLTFEVTHHVLRWLQYQHLGLIILNCSRVEISHHATSPTAACTDADGRCQEIQAPAGVVALEDAAVPWNSCASIKATSYVWQGTWEYFITIEY